MHAFHEAGYRVIATDIDTVATSPAADHYIQADLAKTVTDERYAEKTFADINRYLDGAGLSVLLNNAAIQILGGVDSLSRKDWQTTLDVNLVAPFIWTQAMLPALEMTKGHVINISSIHAKLTKRHFVAYATSKAALSGLTRSMAVDLGDRVRINAIEPAAIETPMLKAGFEGKPAQYAQLEACHPINRIGQPEEVARLALSLVNNDIGFLQGACIGLDGGISLQLHDPD